jgi:NADPH:quinone reductase-like Zn-dependent oxidoreductase
MKAIFCTEYGMSDTLQLKETAKPEPKADEVLINIMASSATAADSMMRQGKPTYGRLFLGLRRPKFPMTGTGFAGVVESIGNEVSQFKIGDRVFGESVFGSGTNAEYVAAPENLVISHIPENMSFEQAAPICDGALTSLNMLQRLSSIKSGQKVLINGASGSLGTAGIQLAKHFGAHVTAVCSGSNHELVRSLGADEVIDYRQQNVCQLDKSYDIIYDSVGTLKFSACKPVLNVNGIFVSPVLSIKLLLQVFLSSIFGNKKAKFDATGLLPTEELMALLKQLLPLYENGQLKTVMDKTYKLADTADAHRYVDTGRKKGNVVIVND